MKRFIALALAGVFLSALSTSAGDKKNPVVVMKTSMGTIKIELYPDKAPITVKNFLQYVDDKYYDGTVFHRVIAKPHSRRDFMIQGGGFLPNDVARSREKPGRRDPIKNEAGTGVSNLRGTIAMARTSDPDSATTQFYINVGDNKDLDKSNDSAGYCAFGKVIEGMDVVDKIKAVEVGNKGPHQNVPVKDVVIESVRRADK